MPVYIMRIVPDGPVKIGCSGDPLRRLREIASDTGKDLEIVRTIDGSFREERAFHKMFKSVRLHGEWFDWCPEMAFAEPDIGLLLADLPQKRSIALTKPQHRWLRIEAAKAGCSVGALVRRIVDAKRGSLAP